MKRLMVLMICLTGPLAACGDGVSRQANFPAGEIVSRGSIKTRAQFVVTLSGKFLVDERRNYVLYAPNGEFWGELGGTAFGGTWEWRGKTLCQNSVPPLVDGCQSWKVMEDTAIAAARRGRGGNGVFRIYD